VGVERRPVHGLVASSAGPGGVSAAVPEAGLMPDENFACAEVVPVGAASRWVGDPLPSRGLHQLAQHSTEHILRRAMRSATYPADDPAAGAVLTA
jgi:hypothetical protein